MALLQNKSIKITKCQNQSSSIYNIKLLKKLPEKKDMKEYHTAILNIYETDNEFNLIFNLKELCIWSIGIAGKEFKFLNEVSAKKEQVRSVAVICSKQIMGIIKFFIGKCEQTVPYKFVQNLNSAFEFVDKQTQKINQGECLDTN